jgi:hypothetical protein
MQRVLILTNPDGTFEVVTDQPAVVIVVDESAPHDRLFQLTNAHTVGGVDAILGADTIGSVEDDRHEAIKGVVLSHIANKPHLKLVD